MARHYNPSIGARLNRIFNFKSGDAVDNEVEGTYAVVPVTPITELVTHNSNTASGNITLHTTSDKKDTYVTGVLLSFVKDATCDIPTGTININSTIAGKARRLADIAVLTLTAQSNQIFVTLPFPIRLDRNVAVNISGTFTAGTCSRTGILFGYEEDVTAS